MHMFCSQEYVLFSILIKQTGFVEYLAVFVALCMIGIFITFRL